MTHTDAVIIIVLLWLIFIRLRYQQDNQPSDYLREQRWRRRQERKDKIMNARWHVLWWYSKESIWDRKP